MPPRSKYVFETISTASGINHTGPASNYHPVTDSASAYGYVIYKSPAVGNSISNLVRSRNIESFVNHLTGADREVYAKALGEARIEADLSQHKGDR